jgi:hypothetical protein
MGKQIRQIRWDQNALQNFIEILDFIKLDSPTNAKKVKTRIMNLIGLQLQVGDFELQNCLPPQNLIRSTKLHLTTEPPIFCRCC